MSPGASRIALVSTVRNERELLRSNLLYHRRLGVARAFVFDDGSTDGTAKTVEDLAFVTILPSANPAAYADRLGLEVAVARAGTDYASRQILNAQCALDLCREQGFEWLVHLDADELLATQDLGSAPNGLVALLDGVPAAKEAVAFPTLEAVQTRLEYDDVFGQETLFKRASPRLRRTVPDPYTGGTIDIAHFFGHSIGKSVVRVAAATCPASVHGFRGAGKRLLSVTTRGALLHYFSHGFADFVRKHRDLPAFDHYASGTALEPHKLLWKRMSRDPAWTDDRFRDYYERHILFKDDQVRRLRRTRRFGFWPVEPAIVEITAARDALQEMGLLDTHGPDSG